MEGSHISSSNRIGMGPSRNVRLGVGVNGSNSRSCEKLCRRQFRGCRGDFLQPYALVPRLAIEYVQMCNKYCTVTASLRLTIRIQALRHRTGNFKIRPVIRIIVRVWPHFSHRRNSQCRDSTRGSSTFIFSRSGYAASWVTRTRSVLVWILLVRNCLITEYRMPN